MYQVIHPTGDYYPRQDSARGTDIYIEVHLNAATDTTRDYASAIVVTDPLPESVSLAAQLAEQAAEVGPHGFNRGVQVGGAGSGNVDHLRTGCPSALWEPCFVSNPNADMWLSRGGAETLGERLARVVRGALPHGGTVALSVGHLGRTSHPTDRGAPRSWGGWEADVAAQIVEVATALLTT